MTKIEDLFDLNIRLTYYHITQHLLANTHLFTEPAEREQHQPSYEVCVCRISASFSSLWDVNNSYGAGQVVYSMFIRAFSLRGAAEIGADGSNQTEPQLETYKP